MMLNVERGSGPLPLRPAKWWVLVGVWLLVAGVYLVFLPNFLRYSNPPTGDQPFYLMDAASIAQDGDLNIANNYANADYDKFYSLAPHPEDFVGMDAPYPPGMQTTASPNRPEDEKYSWHLPGLGMLIAPGWLIGGWFSLWWPATLVIMIAIGALVATNIALLAYEVSGSVLIAGAITIALACCNPLMSYSYLLFTELPTGLLLIYAFRRLALGWQNNGPIRQILVGLCIAYIPWLAGRAAPLAAGIALYALWQWWRARPANARWGRWTDLIPFLTPVVLSVLLLTGYTYFLTGVPFPALTSLEEQRGPANFFWPWAGLDGLNKFSAALVGMGFDETFGLLLYAPIYLLAVPGAIFMAASRHWRPLLLAALLIVGPYFAVLVAFESWYGVWCPPARYMTTLVPLAAAPLAYSLRAIRGFVGWIYGLLFAPLALIGLGFQQIFLKDARLMWPDDKDKVFDWLTLDESSPLRGIDLRPYLPSYVLPSEMQQAASSLLVLVIAAVIVLLGWALLRFSPRIMKAVRKERAKRPLPLLRATLPALVGVLFVGGAWYAATFPYLAPQSTLVEQHRWGLTAALGLEPVIHFGGIAYANGKVYLAVHDDPGKGVWALDTSTGAAAQVWSGGTHPADVVAAPDGRLWVLDDLDEPTDQASAPPNLSFIVALALADGLAQETGALPLSSVTNHAATLSISPDGGALVADPSLGSITRFNPGSGDPAWAWGGPKNSMNNPNFHWLDAQRQQFYVIESTGVVHQANLGPDGQPTPGRDFTLDCLPRGMGGDSASGIVFVSCGDGRPQHVYTINPSTGQVRFSRTIPAKQWEIPSAMAYGDGHLYLLDFNPGDPQLVDYTVQP